MEATCLICAGESSISNPDLNSSESITKFVEQLGIQNQGLPLEQVLLCDDCHSGVVKATKWREQVDEVERDVRSLQRIILKMMRQLKSLLGDYLVEMRKLEGKIRESRGRVGKVKRLRKDKADAFRQGILKVVVEPGVCQEPDANLATSPQIQLENTVKTEVELQHPVGEESRAADKDPLTMEDAIDIEHGNYPAIVPKSEPLPGDGSSPSNKASPFSQTVSRLRLKKDARKFGPCEYCGKIFAQAARLRHHIYTHTGERPYKCHLCPMAYKQKPHLKRHLVSHSGKKPFTCSECGKAFTSKNYLEGHRMLHKVGPKAFPCSVCGQRFNSRQMMMYHVRKTHPNNISK